MLSVPCARGAAPEPPDYSQRNATFATTAAQTPAGRRAPAAAAVRPAAASLPLIAKQPAPGLLHAPAVPAEARPKTLLAFPTREPQGRAAAVISPAEQPAVHFWHWRGDQASSVATGFRGRVISAKVYRAGHGSLSRGEVSPAGLNRFTLHNQPLTPPVQAGSAPTNPR
ncbi:MAG TPA: hypothetical protein VHE13_07800 [Opitutus sp.]|nr:hypothetical protein [Opitutus sp.]